MWTIEETDPPCPFEFFSVMSDQSLCGMNYKQYKEVEGLCLTVIKFSDLTATCDNPIETQWRFTKMYGVTEKYKDVICKKNEEVCDVFTLYEITPEHVVFWLINSTNHVVYSRIMRPRNRNYICVDDCGYFNPDTRKVTKVDKPLKLDLLVTRKPKKASRINNDVTTKKALDEINENFTQKEEFLNEIFSSVKKRDISNKNSNGMHIPVITVEEKTVTNDIPPIEEHIARSKSEKDYIIVSIEDNTVHKEKSRRKRKKQKNLAPEDGVTLEPIVTPDLPEEVHESNEEFLNEELDLSVS
ncbi:hypothetical protein PYW07_012618 [Mythimna separata]|uniref:Uncharacterized protein n=1 Tax=Mythimna separata TaxID=271217 RepID=A0AAD7Y8G2_MYTSE|nr:hypothetical protein PYW07_012618 [Mythimna separata]